MAPRTASLRTLTVALASAGALALGACGGNEAGPTAVPSVSVLGQPASASQLKNGATLYQANCQTCHGGATGGSLRDIPPPHNASGHTWHHPDQQLTDMILKGIPFSAEKERMPPFKDKLSEEKVQAILAYIKTWWTDEQRSSQATVTADWQRSEERSR